VAKTPITLCSIDESLFYSFLTGEKRIDNLKAMLVIRKELEQFEPFYSFCDSVNETIVRSSQREIFSAGQFLKKADNDSNDFFIVLTGMILLKNEGFTENLLPGGMFGDFGVLSGKFKKAEISASEESAVLRIPGENKNRIIKSIPPLQFYINQLENKPEISRV